jgi:hypothetical protein
MNITFTRKYISPHELTDTRIERATKRPMVDIGSTLNVDNSQIRLSYEWIVAQLDNGNRNGSKSISINAIAEWSGCSISKGAVETAMHIAGITGLARKPIFPNVARLRHAGAGQHQNYAMALHQNMYLRNEYARAEPGIDETGLSLRDALEQHRVRMGIDAIQRII